MDPKKPKIEDVSGKSSEDTTTKMYYTVVAPAIIRSNFNYHVSISTHNADELCVMKIGIKGPSFNQEQEVEISPNGTKLINFKLIKLQEGDYNLTVKGISGIKFENERRLTTKQKYYSIFIQTDKATYKPRDLVRFRVLILDPNTRPIKLDEPTEITITDAARNRIKQFKNVEFTKGIYAGELQLSQYPVLGNWKIEVANGDIKETKTFEIAKYVLPKFEVNVEAPKHILMDGKLRATVRAKYTYGKPVKGEAIVTIKTNSLWSNPIKKTAPLDGKAHFEFDLSELLLGFYQSEMIISASVEEKLTGKMLHASATIYVHKAKYKIESVGVPYTYTPNKPFKVTVVVKNYDDTPVKDSKNPIKITLAQNVHTLSLRQCAFFATDGEKSGHAASGVTVEPQPKENSIKQVFEQKLDDNGMATIELLISEIEGERKYGHCTIKASYQGQEVFIAAIKKCVIEEEQTIKDDLELKVVNEKLKLNEDVEVQVLSKDPIKYFIYQVVARGDILKSERIDVGGGKNEHILKIKSTFDMVPQANVFVYFIKDGNIIFKTVNLDFGNQLENSIKIETQEKAYPGEEIDISITTDPESYVGLLGVDQSVLLLKSGNDLNKNAVFEELGRYFSRLGNNAGLITLTNVHVPIIQRNWPYLSHSPLSKCPPQNTFTQPQSLMLFGSGTQKQTSVEKPKPKVFVETRKEFPETWFADLIEDRDKNGQIKLRKKVPDTITSWVLTGFSVNPKTGLGLTEKPIKFQVFQQFFVSINLPYSVKRGEVINIPATVFNYMDENLEADVTLDNSQKEFDFVEVTNDVDEVLTEDLKRTKRIAIPANTGESAFFLIRPKKVGNITLKLAAVSPISGDAVEQILLVEPEGITQFRNKAVFVNLTKQKEHKEIIDIEVPENVVPDSVYSEISVAGNLLGPTIKNLDSLVRKPYGCGEQNMVNFVPNILVLRYLEGLNKLTPLVEKKAKKFLEIGYQRELSYKHLDGSYSAFGRSDNRGSTWLTAYVARSFRQAAKYTQIDEKVIGKALEFLAKNQAENGSFLEVGRVIDYKMVKDGKDIFLTAFTLMAFLENKEAFPEYNDNIKKGLDYLSKNLEDNINVYSHAITAFVFQMANHEQKDAVTYKLKTRAIQQDDCKYWADIPEVPKEENKKKWWYEPLTSNIETTSYALMALMQADVMGNEIVSIMKWLVSKSNSLGGYYSTQATVVGLQAFIAFSEKFGATEKGDININFADDQDTSGKITINDDSSLLLQTHVLPPSAQHVSFIAIGKGSILVRVSYRYNIESIPEEPRFKLNVKIKDSNTAEFLKMDVYTSFISTEKEKESNIAVMEVSLPTGYIADQDNLKALKEMKSVKRIETKKGETVVVVYFDNLSSNDICVPVEGLQTHKVGKQKPAAVVVYDYYDSSRQARTFYAPPKSSLCDICESGGDSGNKCDAKA